MTHQQATPPPAPHAPGIDLPRPTVWPMVLSLGVMLLAAGLATSLAFSLVGAGFLLVGLLGWVGELVSDHGHVHESPSPLKPAPVVPSLGGVEKLRPGMAGYRMRLPLKVHPISAGVKGGIVGGLVMPLPALAYGLFSGHGIWFPVNLLAGIVLPGVENMTLEQLEQFSPSLLLVSLCIHAIGSVVIGLLYGVLLPTLPEVPRPIAWGGLLMPLLWSAVTFTLMGLVNRPLAQGVDWPWFIVSQFLFGVAAALVVLLFPRRPPVASGLLGGLVGGLVMPVPALLWSLGHGHSIWHPVNLLAAMLLPEMAELTPAQLEVYHPTWLAAGLGLHAAFSLGFGLLYGLLLPRLPALPAPLVWGGVLMPLLWTGASFGLMGVLNPVLQHRVSWPWFIVSQFVYGIAAAVVVVRTEMVPTTPAGAEIPPGELA